MADLHCHPFVSGPCRRTCPRCGGNLATSFWGRLAADFWPRLLLHTAALVATVVAVSLSSHTATWL